MIEIKPAKEAIVFVPALGEHAVDQSPRLIAEKLVRALRLAPNLDGVQSLSAEKIPSLVFDKVTWKEAEGARLTGDDGALYDLYKFDYRDRLDFHRDMGAVRRVLATLGSALALTVRLARAFNPLKSLKRPTRFQALAAVLVVLVMWLSLLFGASVLWTQLVEQEVAAKLNLQEPLKVLSTAFAQFDATAAALTTAFGIPLAAVVGALRDAASRYAGAVDYLNHPDDNEYREDLLALARELKNAGYSRVHAVGYSFGALILIDTLFPHHSAERSEPPVTSSPFASVVTVGSVFDFVKAFWPEHFHSRLLPTPMPPWINIFSAEDVLGSRIEEVHLVAGFNAIEDEEQASALCRQIPYRVSPKPLGLAQLALQAGFRNHGNYWNNRRDETDVWRLVAAEGFLSVGASVPALASE